MKKKKTPSPVKKKSLVKRKAATATAGKKKPSALKAKWKLTKQAESEALKTHDLYWKSYLIGDIETLASLLDDHYTQIGSAENEVFFNKKDAVKFVHETIDQVAGNVEMRNRVTKAEPIDGFVLLHEQCDLYVLIKGVWTFYSKFRASSLMQKTETGWKMVHQHSSLPDSKAQEGENITLEKISAENLQLRDAVKRRTNELETKNRELEIEAALERVRARAMAMQHSNELSDVVYVLYKQMQQLGFDYGACTITLMNTATGDTDWWMAGFSELEYPDCYHVNYFDHPGYKAVLDAWKRKEKFASIEIKGASKRAYDKIMFSETGFSKLPEHVKAMMAGFNSVIYSMAYMRYGALSFGPTSITDEQKHMLQKFAEVFEQTYTRFLDLQKVEAQTREAQIQLALERVRARTMAMQRSENLKEVVKELYEQLRILGFEWGVAAIIIMDSTTGDLDWWMEGFADGYDLPDRYHVPYFDHKGHKQQLENWKNGNKYAVVEISGLEKKSYDKYYFNQTDFVRAPESTKQLMMQQEAVLFSMAYMQYGALSWSPSPLTEDQAKILQRFAKVFEQTYTRFLDLQKAEAQAREAQIEAALERVRSRSLAMHHSEELEHVVASLFDRLTELGISFDGASIFLFEQEKRSIQLWVASKISAPLKVILPYDKDIKANPITKDLWNAIDTGEDIINKAYSGKVKDDYYHYVFRYNESLIPEWIMKMMLEAESWTVTLAAEKNSAVCIDSWYGTITTEENYQVIKRFARVFQQAYTRFLDLQKAEAQAREAQIQLALERVRARTMAMQRSDELAEAAQLLYQQFHSLGIKTYTCAYMFIEEAQNLQRGWTVSSDGTLLPNFFDFPLTGDPILDQRFQSWKNKQPIHEAELKGEANKQHHTFLVSLQPPEFAQHIVAQLPDRVFFYNANFRYGYLFIVNTEPLTAEEKEIAIRFANVFEQTYTRFLDLQKAEAQTREAQIEAALERVRSRSMAMHESNELAYVALTLYEELQKLDFKFGAATVVIMNEETGDMEHWVAGFSQKKYPECYKISYFNHPCHEAQLTAWKNHEKILVYPIIGDERTSYTNYIFENTDYKNFPEQEKVWMRNTDPVFTLAYMKHGAIMWAPNPATSEQLEILQRFAKVFEQSYTRFLDLQKAEAQAREAQIEAALEKIRSRSLAMHHSGELRDVIAVFFEKLIELGTLLGTVGIGLYDQKSKDISCWVGNAIQNPQLVVAPFDDAIMKEENFISQSWKAMTEKTEMVNVVYSREQKDRYFNHLFAHNDLVQIPESAREILRKMEKHTVCFIPNHYSSLFVDSWDGKQYSDDDITILRRAGKVFEQAYVRFLDLQKAEAQAREAEIQLALERVRARTMAMHHSSELSEAAELLFEQLSHLGTALWGCGFNICSENSDTVERWMCQANGKMMDPLTIPYSFSADEQQMREVWRTGTELISWVQEGVELEEAFKKLQQHPSTNIISQRIAEIIETGIPAPNWIKHYVCSYKDGYLWIMTTKPFEETHIFVRFAKVFEQTYTRFLDLQKAEAQARESQIQLALERVRAKTMAMQSSDDLLGVANVLREQMGNLGQPELESSIVHLYHDSSPLLEAWYAFRPPNLSSGEIITGVGIVPKECSAWSREVIAKYNSPETEYTIVASGEKLIEWYKVLEQYAKATVDYDENGQLVVPEVLHYHFSKFSGGALLMISNQEPSAEARELQRRAAVVFDLAYTRFLDLKKAEAQAREAQIEGALEKVRSRSLAMHKSDELQEVVNTVFDRLKDLNMEMDSANIAIFKQGARDFDYWIASPVQNRPAVFHMPYIDWGITKDLMDAKESGADFFEKTYARDEKDTWFRDRFEKTDFKFIDESRKRYILDAPGLTVALGLCRNTGVQINRYSTTPLVEVDIAILKRFSKIFEQAYTRFLDLQKAEAQAKEAQIEAALERVRSRTMGMQKSEDLREVVKVLYTQLKELGFQKGVAAINIMDPDSGDIDTWSEGFEDGYDLPEKYHVPWFEHRGHHEIIRHWKSGKPYAVVEITGQDKKSLDNYYFFHTDFIRVPETTKQFMMQQDAILFSMAYMQYGALTWSPSPISDEQSKILQRFAKVFEQTYTRFLDLQKAEAQTREAQIEASLERVRSRAMAMHSSEDLTATISAFYHELELFSITPRRCGVGLLDKETHMAELSTMNTTEQGKSIEIIGRLKLVGHPVLEGIFDNWLLQKEYHPILRGNEIKEYYQLIRQNVAFPEYPNDAIQYGYFFFFVEGGVYAWTEKPLSGDELKIYRRFTTVLSLTYKRYKDLKDAEVREQEAIKQAALDRVRADIASMRNTADLDRITPLIWKELTTLGIPFIRCGVFIMDDKENKVHTYLSTPEGQAIAAYHIPMNDSGSLAGAIDHWREQKVFVTHWVESDFITQAEVLLKQGSITAREQYLNTLPKGGFHLHFLPFSQGMLYVGSHESLPSEVLQLVQSLADAFSVAYARYEDFTKLESAKAQIEKTLTDLKQTQTQLIQSEKMASLGELTAGIAHEIQNPLNFVNNFSEVSTELIDEMKEELAVGNQQLAIEIANDLKQNLEKINHHGKRADGIVKSMLQHSRAGSGKKELTDINALCDEYLRLSYHGLRAKDKSFNAKFEIQCDPELPKLNVLPQDVGRVVLNLINNAFYAVSERQKVESETLTESGKPKAESLRSSVDKYEPAVTVTTKYLGDKIEIRVKDNGTGIPAKVKEKIFQPFFTTKPTGQGTGLGLSLSYDIITKGHGGEIKIETEEGKGTEFIVQLPIV